MFFLTHSLSNCPFEAADTQLSPVELELPYSMYRSGTWIRTSEYLHSAISQPHSADAIVVYTLVKRVLARDELAGQGG